MKAPHEVSNAITNALTLHEWWSEPEKDGKQVIYISTTETDTVKLTIQPVEDAALDYAPVEEQRKHLEEPCVPPKVAP